MLMRRCTLAVGLAALLSAGVGWTWAQERPSTDRFTSQYRRVPPFFGQVGITPEQREQIYTIRGEYDQKISELMRQLEELKAQEMTACESVLTPAQRQLLVQLRAARTNRSTAKANAPAPLDSVEVPDPPADADNPADPGN